MPSSIFFNQQRVYRPGTYIRVVDRLSEISDTSSGNICLIGDFPIFKQGELMTFSSFDSMLDATRNGITYGGIDYDGIATAAFSALAGSTGQPDSLTLINVRESKQAAYDNQGLRVISRLYGTIGEQLRASLSANAEDATMWDINIYQGDNPDPIEVIEAIGDGADAFATLTYNANNTAYSDVFVEVDATHLIVKAEVDLAAQTIVAGVDADDVFTYDVNKRVEGDVSVLCQGNLPAAGASEITMVVKGLTAAGAQVEESVLLVDPNDGQEVGDTFTTSNEFRFIESISFTNADGFVGAAKLTFFPKKTLLADIDDLEAWMSELVLRNDDFSFVAPSVFPTSGETLDRKAEASISGGVDFSFPTDLYRIVDRAFNNSDLVTAERISNVPPTAFNQTEGVLTGTDLEDVTIDVSDWQDALDSILYKNVNIVVPATDQIGIHLLVKQHCKDAAGKAGRERNAWIGSEADRSLSYVSNAFVKDLNDRNCAVVCQGIKLEKNGKEFEQPWFTALCLASIQASTPVGEPMTRKVLNAIRPIQTTFDPDRDANKAIRLGIVVINDSFGPVRVERSVTTYVKNPEHPFFTEVSANESINVCIRTLRAKLDSFIGSKATAEQANSIASSARNHLNELRAQQVIADYRNVSVTLDGDRLNVIFDVAAIEPLNFITVTANIGQL